MKDRDTVLSPYTKLVKVMHIVVNVSENLSECYSSDYTIGVYSMFFWLAKVYFIFFIRHIPIYPQHFSGEIDK